MTAVIYLTALCAVVVVLCLSVVVLRLTERRFPAFSRWLDARVGPEPEWRKW